VNKVVEYIKYKWNAKGRHGIHSPFIYDIVDKMLSVELAKNDEKQLVDLFSSYQHNSDIISIKDFGAGSKKLGAERKINQIFKTSSSKGKFGLLLYQLANYFKPENILEFGTSLGVGTFHFHLGNKTSKITTVEACPETYKFTSQFIKNKVSNVEFINSTFNDFLKNENNIKYDLIFVDGHHDGEALIHYMKELKSLSHNDTIFVLDDIRWSDSMFEAWNILKSSSDFHVSIDFFRMGILIPRKQQEKEHFILKI